MIRLREISMFKEAHTAHANRRMRRGRLGRLWKFTRRYLITWEYPT